MLARAGDALAADLPLLGFHPSEQALAELRGLDGLLGGPPQAWALTPSDACPDNNRLTADGLVLLDLEGAQLRHVAWDAAYLLVPWPSCWCSWRLPADVAHAALESWRAAVALPYAHDPAFEDDLRTVSLGWAMTSAGWFLQRAVQDDHPHPAAPTRKAIVQHRLVAAVEVPHRQLPRWPRSRTSCCSRPTTRGARWPCSWPRPSADRPRLAGLARLGAFRT